MPNVKTAISLQKPLFDQINGLAGKLNISRSRLFVLAVEEFIQRYENQKLLDDINHAYDDLPTTEEQTLQRKMRQQHRRLVEGQW
jgi:metal-responsive CopG/Arc/MetJ family transcriptional regulator